MNRDEIQLIEAEFQYGQADLRCLKPLVSKGLSLQEARDRVANKITKNKELCEVYRAMARNQLGRERFVRATKAYPELGVEPPFADVVDLDWLVLGIKKLNK